MEKHTTCFLIDNDIDDQEIFKMALRQIDQNISCAVADDGVSAIQQLKADPDFIPSFIFIDMNMPLMNGKQCLEEIRKLPWLHSVPVYMYSTATNPHYIEDTKKAGATGFIVKPSGFQKLVDLLSKVLATRHVAL